MLTDIWGKRSLLCIFARPIKKRCIFFWACIKNYHLSQKTTDDNAIASKEKTMLLNKETTTFSLQDMFRHSYVIFSCKCDFDGCTFEFI